MGLSGAFADRELDLLPQDRIYAGTQTHSTLPDSVMNYDEMIPENFNPDLGEKGEWLRVEHNCSPHPLDVMAIHALYQTLDYTRVGGGDD